MSVRFRSFAILLGLATFAVSLVGCGDRLSNPEEIISRVASQAEADYAGIDDFTVMAGNARLYYRRVAEDSLANFELRAVSGDSTNEQAIYDPYHLPNVARLTDGLRDNARFGGSGTLGGHPVLVLEVIDPLKFVGATAGDSLAVGPDSAAVYVDAETFRIREIELKAVPDGADEPLVQRQRYTEFRTVEGLTIPFLASTIVEGIDVPDETRIVEAPGIAMARARAQQLPEGPERDAELRRIQRRERFITQGIMETPFQVDSVWVNRGVPEDLY
ncbi:MAG: hypothetical protein R3284_05015 [Rubricoccaceae bacterium]|nr:hypothetical protein [Rubricoccaceae bacterium]